MKTARRACAVTVLLSAATVAAAWTPKPVADDPLVRMPGTQPGEVFRFRGEGIPSLRGYGRGDQIMEVVVKTPTNLNKKQEGLLKEFAKLESAKLSSRIKKMFTN